MPARIKTLVLTQFRFFQIVWNGIGKLNLQLLQRRLAIGLQIQTIKRLQCKCNAVISHVIRQSNEVKIVSGGVALENQYSFNAQNFTLGRNGNSFAVVVHNRCFQRLIADQLPNPSFDTIEATENLHGTLYSGSFPASHRFKFLEHIVEATAQVSQNMICITRETMLCMNCGCRTTNQYGVRQDALKARCG